MKAKRIQLMLAMVLLLIGTAGLTHTALEQSQAHASSDSVVVVVPSIAQIEAEIGNIAEMAQMEKQSGSPGRIEAPAPPTRPTPPPTPEVIVDLRTWIGLTVAFFIPFALLGWYLDRRTQSAMYEQPLA